MIEAVLDTNVLVSGFTSRTSSPAGILSAWLDRKFELVLTEHIMAELTRTLRAPYYRARLSAQATADFIRLLGLSATSVDVTFPVVGVATHPEDDLILATAVSAQADYLVTGDRQLRKLGSFQGVTIVTPVEFLAVLAGAQ